MGVDSDGLGPSASPNSQLVLPSMERKCPSKGCNRAVQAVSPGNHKYCTECKITRSSHVHSSKQNKKRDSSALSPIVYIQSKLSKADDFAFTFKSSFRCDFDSFSILDKLSQLSKFFQCHRTPLPPKPLHIIAKLADWDQVNLLNAKLNSTKLALGLLQTKKFGY